MITFKRFLVESNPPSGSDHHYRPVKFKTGDVEHHVTVHKIRTYREGEHDHEFRIRNVNDPVGKNVTKHSDLESVHRELIRLGHDPIKSRID